MKSFDDKWYRYHMEEKEELFEMKRVFWYKTKDDNDCVIFIPFYLNLDKSTIKILTTRKEFSVINSPICVEVNTNEPFNDLDEINPRRKIIYKPNIKKTLQIATDKIGEVYDSATILEKYYFSDESKSATKYWVETHTRSQEEIFRMARYVNKDYKKQQEQEK